MAKYYVHRTALAYVTEIAEVEAGSEAEAQALHDEQGTGQYLGLYVGDYAAVDQLTYEVTPASTFYLPVPFFPQGSGQ